MYLLDFKQERIENAHFKSLEWYMQSNGLDFVSKIFFLQIEKKTKRKRKTQTSSSAYSSSSEERDHKKTKKDFVQAIGKISPYSQK